jgi:2-dehydro-3-deoxyphosphogluconate aldolase/(4S)-4-hydroxy-2-oxoglutarate aldolase
MSKFKRITVLNTIINTGLVPIFYHSDVDTAKKIINACLDGGVRCVEFTNRGDRAHIVFQALAEGFKDEKRLILGAGSVLDAGTAALYIQLGADFIVGPAFNAEVARLCNRRKISYSPGCGTVSEISLAEEYGVEIVKIFPGSQVGGPSFVKAVRGPMPWTHLMPTGGVTPTEENIKAWFEAGVVAVGMGSKLIRKDLVASGDFDSIRDLAKQTLAWIQAFRTNGLINKS